MLKSHSFPAFLIIASLLAFTGASVLKDPTPPVPPEVDMKEGTSGGNFSFSASVRFADGKEASGVIYLSAGAFDLAAKGGGEKVSVRVQDISMIEILRWKGESRDGKTYLFRPSLEKITLKNGRSIEGSIAGRIIDGFIFQEQNVKRRIFTVFYDYLKNGAWSNSGETSADYPEKNPHPGAVVRISAGEQ